MMISSQLEGTYLLFGIFLQDLLERLVLAEEKFMKIACRIMVAYAFDIASLRKVLYAWNTLLSGDGAKDPFKGVHATQFRRKDIKTGYVCFWSKLEAEINRNLGKVRPAHRALVLVPHDLN